MKSSKDPPRVQGAPAHDRLADFRKMFSEIRRLMAFYALTTSPSRRLTPRGTRQKLEELHQLQQLLLQAEGALYDEPIQEGDTKIIDIEALKDQIGRRLDRIRAALDAAKIPSGADTE